MRQLVHLLVIRPLLRLLFGINAEGREHLAGLDQYILIANHNSHLDIPLLFSLLPRADLKRTHAVAARDYFGPRPILFRLADYLFRPIWIDREGKAGDPLEEMTRKLRDGENIIIFPEGTRGRPGSIARFKTGVGRLAETFREIPVVPVLVCGPERSLPKGGGFPLPIYNKVLVAPPLVFRGDCRDTTAALERVMRELSESEAARRHRRLPRRRRSRVIAVLGIDGSGKSSLSRELSLKLSEKATVCLVSDELEFYEGARRREVQPLLTEKVRRSLGRYAKTAGSLKHYKLPKLAELLLRDQLLRQVCKWYAPRLIVLDGAPLLNLVAWSNLYKERELDRSTCSTVLRILSGDDRVVARNDPIYTRFPELRLLERLKLARLGLPDLAIMLDLPPSTAIARIHGRGGQVQVHETQEKLGRLREGYLVVCEAVRGDLGRQVTVLDAERGQEAVADDALSSLRGFLEKESVLV